MGLYLTYMLTFVTGVVVSPVKCFYISLEPRFGQPAGFNYTDVSCRLLHNSVRLCNQIHANFANLALC